MIATTTVRSPTQRTRLAPADPDHPAPDPRYDENHRFRDLSVVCPIFVHKLYGQSGLCVSKTRTALRSITVIKNVLPAADKDVLSLTTPLTFEMHD